MPRIARDAIAGIPYHIIHRGNNKQKIFFCDDDYRYFISLIAQAKKKYGCNLYSYVLMPNHVHFILEPIEQAENLHKFIKLLAQKYAQHSNKKYKRTGTLWEGRFKSSPISEDSYLLTCGRYIEMNPVRAGIVKDAAQYKWSSYRYKIGIENNVLFLDRDPLYLDFGANDAERKKKYKEWFEHNDTAESTLDLIRETINKNTVFGNEKFKESLEKLLGRDLTPKKQGRPRKTAKEEK